MLVAHVVIAFTSLVIASLTALTPTKQKLFITYITTVGTLVSGVMLMVFETVPVSRVCISGGAFLASVIALTVIAKRRLTSKAKLY